MNDFFLSYAVLRRGKTTFIWKKANCQPEYKNVSKNLGQSSSSPHSVFCIVYPSICLTHEIPHAGMEFLLRGLEIGGGREGEGGRKEWEKERRREVGEKVPLSKMKLGTLALHFLFHKKAGKLYTRWHSSSQWSQGNSKHPNEVNPKHVDSQKIRK